MFLKAVQSKQYLEMNDFLNFYLKLLPKLSAPEGIIFYSFSGDCLAHYLLESGSSTWYTSIC